MQKLEIMSSKDIEKKFVGQPIFKQLIDFIPKSKFELLAQKHQTDRYYKAFPAWTQLVTILFGVFCRCDSMGEICDGMLAMQGKLNHLGLDKSPAKSTAGDGLRERDNDFYKDFYFLLLKYFEPLLSVSRIDRISFDKLFIFDSTTIRLFSQIMKGVGRNPKGEGKKKGGLKVHMLIDAHSQTPTFVKISEAKSHDKNFIQYLNLAPHSMIVFDRAYNHYLQFAKFTERQINFVCRLKSNAVYDVVQELYCQRQSDSGFGVLKTEHIHLKYKEDKQEKSLCLRKVEISDEEVALIYKIRWQIELLFKKLKQNFQLHYFYSESENGIKTQIWITLIAQLLLMVLKTKSDTKKAFSTVAALVRIHLISNLDVFWVIENSRRTFTKRRKRAKPPNIQIELF